LKSAELIDDSHCFVCGKDNPAGLNISWKTSGNVTEASFTISKAHQGWKDLVHGGILATVLDEAMTRLAWERFGGAVTAEMTVRYLRPAKIGDRMSVRGEVEEAKGRLIPAKAEIRDGAGQIVAEATGKAIKAKQK
jgi:uncharacterized protein (TIGR00369 family)